MISPLEDVQVIELTQMVAGPLAGMTLADLGADVIKIERPGTGEISRSTDPKVGSESFYYLSLNRGKRSVSLDLKSDAGREIFLDLVEDADVVLENFSPGTLERLGIGHDRIEEQNPEIIHCSISGFGQTGPKSDRPGVDGIVQSFSGIASLTRTDEGDPQVSGLPISDISGAVYGAIGILEALHLREKTGEGEHLDIALSDASLSLLSARAGYSFATGEPFPSMKEHPYFAPVSFYETETDDVRISIVTERQWEQLCAALDRDDLADNPAYATVDDRLENRDALNDELQEILAEKTADEWESIFEEYHFPFTRVHDTVSVWEDEHVEERDMVTTIRTPDDDEFRTVSYPVKHRGGEFDPPSGRAPALGEHVEDVLTSRGYTEEEIDELRDDGVI